MSLFIFYISQRQAAQGGYSSSAVIRDQSPFFFHHQLIHALYLQIEKYLLKLLSPHLHIRLQEEGMEKDLMAESILFKESSQKGHIVFPFASPWLECRHLITQLQGKGHWKCSFFTTPNKISNVLIKKGEMDIVPCANYLTSSNFSFVICEMGTILHTTNFLAWKST